MALELATGNLLNMLGGLVVVGFGVFVAVVAGRAPASRAFVVFAVGFGFAVAMRNLGDMAVSTPRLAFALYVLAGLFWLLAAAGLIRLGLAFPNPLARQERRALVLPLIIFATGVLYIPLLLWSPILHAFTGGRLVEAGLLTYVVLSGPGFGAMWALLVLLPLRVPTATSGERSQLALLSAAILPYMSYSTGLLLHEPSPVFRNAGLIWAAYVLVITALWLRVSAAGTWPRTARDLALLGPLMMLYGAVEAVFFGSSAVTGTVFGTSGILRIIAVAVLSYAVVRHQLLGIDMKLRFAISKSTIAAVFIAVFFIASEAAQQFFGEQFESNYLGIVAAGALVFAIAPLSRVADRLAEKAVPVAGPPVTAARESNAGRREETYRDALQIAMQDRRITRDEEVRLHRLADELGIAPSRAHQILVEVERDSVAARDATGADDVA